MSFSSNYASWTQIVGSGSVPAGTAKISAEIVTFDYLNPNAGVYVDDVSVSAPGGEVLIANGEIDLFDTNNFKVGIINPHGAIVGPDLSDLGNNQWAQLNVVDGPAVSPSIQLHPGTTSTPTQVWTAGYVRTFQTATGVAAAQALQIQSPRTASQTQSNTSQILVGGDRADGSSLGQIQHLSGTHVFNRNNGIDGIVVTPGASGAGGVIVPQISGLGETWHGVAGGVGFINNFADIGGVQTARYRLMPDGTVSLSGSVKTTAPVTGPVTGFILPVGYRPAAEELFPMNGPTAGAFISVANSGAVQFENFGTATLGFVGLSHVRFAVSSLT